MSEAYTMLATDTLLREWGRLGQVLREIEDGLPAEREKHAEIGRELERRARNDALVRERMAEAMG